MRGFTFPLVALIAILSIAPARADMLISGFSPNENPFEYSGFDGSLTTNPDGTQTLLQDGILRSLWIIHAFPPIADLTQEGSNDSVSLRARLEPPHQAIGAFQIHLSSAAADGSAIAKIPYSALEVGNFATLRIPFSDFAFQPAGHVTHPELVLQTVRVVLITGWNDEHDVTHSITFDSLYAIPEPSAIVLISFALPLVLLVCRRTGRH